MKYLFFTLFLFFAYLNCFSQKDIGSPFITSFSPKIYEGDPQIWSIQQGNNGIMYFSGEQIHAYDGVSWQAITIPNAVVIRSLAKDDKGRIYAGTKDNFGYLQASDSVGDMHFVSLSQQLPDSLKNFGDTWEIYTDHQLIYFHTSSGIFRFDWQTQKFAYWEIIDTKLRGITYDGYLYFVQRGQGLVRIKEEGQDPELIANTEVLKNNPLTGVVILDEDNLLFVTQRSNIFTFSLKEQKLTPFLDGNTQIAIEIKSGEFTLPYHLSKLKDGTFFLSTIFKGGYLFDSQGKIIQHIDKTNGLTTATVPFSYQDRSGNLWLATDNGIVKTEFETPFRFWESTESKYEGTILALQEFNDKMYIGTPEGLYSLNTQTNRFQKIKGIDEFCWDIQVMDIGGVSQLYAISQYDFFQIKDSVAIKLSASNSANSIHIFDGNKFILAGKEDISLAEFDENGKVNFINRQTIKDVEFRTIAKYKDKFWFGTLEEGLYYVPFNKDSLLLSQLTKVDTSQGLPLMANNKVFYYTDGFVITTTNGIYKWNEKSKKVEPHPVFTNASKENYQVLRFASTQKNEIYLLESNENYLASKINLEDGKAIKTEQPFLRVPSIIAQVIFIDHQNTVWVGGSEGLYRFYPQKSKQYDYTKIPTPLIRSVILGEDSVFFAGNYVDTDGKLLLSQPKEQQPQFEYEQNSMTFSFALPNFQERNTFSYQLEGYDKTFSNWTKETKKSYTNLPEGKYIFKVKAKNIYQIESEITSYSFTILSPWYRSWWAYILYVGLASLAIWGFVWINTTRLKKANQKLESTVKERTSKLVESNQEVLQQNAQLNQQKEEIEAQSENLKTLNLDLESQKIEVEKAYKNVQLLSEIGQEITAILDLEEIIQAVYQNVNALMPADGFGIGVFDTSQDRISFSGFMEKGQKLPYHFNTLDEKTFAVRCFVNSEEIIINDVESEKVNYPEYILDATEGENPLSFVYLPIQLENKQLGVITVQSFKENAYSEREITFLRSLASYVSIALDNSSAYQLINEKNQKITDSIRYAQTIQHAILPSEKKIEKPFRLSNEDYQIIFRPKDIVSGDFYWTSQTTDYFFVAVVDCTGHGVPGAFMSMIGNTLLTEIVEIQKIYEPSLILDKFNEQFVEALRQDENANSDGMDVCLCRVNFNNKKTEIVFAGAKRPLFYTDYNKNQENKIQRLQGTRKSVGGKQRNQNNFEQHILLLNKKSRIYLSTDGLVDQNNTQGEKIGTSKLIYLIEQSSHLSIKEQIKEVENELVKHQQNAEQRDDITFIGIEV
ncbi:SpoIIE family protein phosphatase [Bernardetia sp. MNP-M8]|uniref:SpoIIE family protein phosphatase n=1 Tax=Bernardetia sp. MNP-M8 TaxID=3127470 RepID=UPI0030CC38CF